MIIKSETKLPILAARNILIFICNIQPNFNTYKGNPKSLCIILLQQSSKSTMTKLDKSRKVTTSF